MAIKLDRSYDIQPSPDSPLETDLVTKMFHNFRIDIVEKQDALIMDAIHRIGGDQYQHITIDKSKVIDALGKSVPKKVIMSSKLDALNTIHQFTCPTCMRNIVALDDRIARVYGDAFKYPLHRFEDKYGYCGSCGQKLDWDLEKEKEDEKEI